MPKMSVLELVIDRGSDHIDFVMHISIVIHISIVCLQHVVCGYLFLYSPYFSCLYPMA